MSDNSIKDSDSSSISSPHEISCIVDEDKKCFADNYNSYYSKNELTRLKENIKK